MKWDSRAAGSPAAYARKTTCAAAAAKAAAAFLLCGKADSDYSELTLPGGTVCRIQVTRYEPEQETESPAFCYFVQKDSGDDPELRYLPEYARRIKASSKPYAGRVPDIIWRNIRSSI